MSKAHLFQERKYYIHRGFTREDIGSIIATHRGRKGSYMTLSNYYKGKHDILQRQFNDPSKPNNRAVNNFAKLIVDTGTAYFIGEPVSYSSKEKRVLEAITETLKENFSDDVDSELAKMTGIYGHAFEVHWIAPDGSHRFKAVSPEDIIICYSMDLDEEPLCAIMYHTYRDVDGHTVYDVQMFTKDSIERFSIGENNSVSNVQTTPHYFGQLPVIEYISSEERLGDFEPVISLIDAYNVAVSDSINDIEYWNDAYLLLRNLSATDMEDIQRMKENRVLLVDGEGDAEFITKNIQDTHIENIKDRLTMDIHKFSQTPNLNDEQFATNLSGVAIKYKMLGLENKTAIKERKFKSALMKRISIILSVHNLKGNSFTFPELDIVFVRNLPANLVEIADMIAKIRGVVSDETLRSQLPFIVDLELEKERLDAEQEEKMTYDIMNPFTTPEGEEEEESDEKEPKENGSE